MIILIISVAAYILFGVCNAIADFIKVNRIDSKNRKMVTNIPELIKEA